MHTHLYLRSTIYMESGGGGDDCAQKQNCDFSTHHSLYLLDLIIVYHYHSLPSKSSFFALYTPLRNISF